MDILVFSMVLSSAFFHACWNFAAKKVSGNLSVIWISLWISFCITLPFAWYVGMPQKISAELWGWILVSGFALAIYFIFLGKSYEHGDISLVYPIARGFGVMGTALIAFVFLEEPLSLIGTSGIITVCVGIFLLSIPKMSVTRQYHAIWYALGVGSTIICYSILGKIVVQEVHPFTYAFILRFLEAIFLAPFVLCTKWKSELQTAWKQYKKYIFIIGIGSPIVYTVILFAFQLAPASYVVAVRETSVVFGALLGFIFLREKCTWQKVLGIGAIVTGMVFIKLA